MKNGSEHSPAQTRRPSTFPPCGSLTRKRALSPDGRAHQPSCIGLRRRRLVPELRSRRSARTRIARGRRGTPDARGRWSAAATGSGRRSRPRRTSPARPAAARSSPERGGLAAPGWERRRSRRCRRPVRRALGVRRNGRTWSYLLRATDSVLSPRVPAPPAGAGTRAMRSVGRQLQQRLEGRVLERLGGAGVVQHLLERLLHRQRLSRPASPSASDRRQQSCPLRSRAP